MDSTEEASARPPQHRGSPAAGHARRPLGRPGPGHRAWATLLALSATLGWFPSAAADAAKHSAAQIPLSVAADPGSPLPRQRVLRRALAGDPSQQYLLYVPGRGGQGAPIFVTAHGVSRNSEEHASLFAPYAERYGVVLIAPCFEPDTHDDYQRLGRPGRGRRSDFALDSVVAEVAALTGSSATKFYLFGFSGGAQFAHRYLMAHPERIAAAALGAAGWYTFPDPSVPYPYGIGHGDEPSAMRFDPAKFLRVPIQVLVGEADVQGGENLRRGAEIDRQQGTTRLARARNWTAAMRKAAEARGMKPLVTCQEAPGIQHSFRQFMEEGALGDRVFSALFGPARSDGPVGTPSASSSGSR